MRPAALYAAGTPKGLAERAASDPALQRIRDAIAQRPTAGLIAVVTGPGGSGKTSAASWITEAYRLAGQPVAHLQDTPHGPWPLDTVLLAEDAHLLEHTAATALRDFAATPGARLVVTRRPWPETSELDEVLAAARRHGASVWLGHLSLSAVTALVEAADLPGAPPVEALARHLHASTGGLPSLVDLHLRGDAAQWMDDGAPGESPAVADYLRRELRHLSDPAVALLHALSVGVPWDTALLATVLDLPAPAIVDASAEARASGLLRDDSAVIDDARAAVSSMVAGSRTHEVQRAALEALCAGGDVTVDVARALAAAGTRDVRLGAILAEAGWAAVPVDPANALELFDRAEHAGASSHAIAAGRAEAAAALGLSDAALGYADTALSHGSEHDIVRAATVSASVLTRAGLTDRAADIYQWLGPQRAGWSAPLASVTLLSVGRLDTAAQFLAADAGSVPTSLDTGRTLMARAIAASLSPGRAESAGALADLVRSSTLVRGGISALWPASPAALGALLALHTGEPATAESLLEREGGGPGAARHLGLLGWAAMQRGNLAQATAMLDDAQRGTTGSPQGLTGRDEFFAFALRAGIARRNSDPEAMRAAWAQARESLLGVSSDLFLLLPLGELAIVAARLGESDRIAAHLSEADALLRALGDPPAWSMALHWARFHAAIAASRPDDLAASAAALVRAAASLPMAAALARAGRCWTQLLSGQIDPDAVIASAHELQRIGLAWDGSRLAGQAAAQATDRRAMHALLQCARGLVAAVPGAEGPGLGAVTAAGDAARLSDREREVAELVLAGKTYRQIGDQLFIAAKTVEHHVARIRQRLGATSRSDLFARLRAALEYGDGDLRLEPVPEQRSGEASA